jgi:hypothetical protein
VQCQRRKSSCRCSIRIAYIARPQPDVRTCSNACMSILSSSRLQCSAREKPSYAAAVGSKVNVAVPMADPLPLLQHSCQTIDPGYAIRHVNAMARL